MRIISGKYKGRKVDGYNIDGTRPTMDRVKESLIAMIQRNLDNSICLDLFAGSGSVGFEMISNGAKACYFVDNNYKVIETLKKNKQILKIEENCFFIKNDFQKALLEFKENNVKFDMIFLDPPYALNYIVPAINLICEYGLLSKDGIIICECENENIDIQNLELIKEKKYGSKNIKIFKNNIL